MFRKKDIWTLYRRAKKGIKNPTLTSHYLRKSVYIPSIEDSQELQQLFNSTGIQTSTLKQYLDEIESNPYIERGHRAYGRNNPFKTEAPIRGVALYILVREYSPEVIVETGVYHGLSTLYLLSALEKNGAGQLYSIDLPNEGLPPENDPGWIIPDEIRDRWELQIGDAKEQLPELVESVQTVDLFFHDSAHSYEHMSFELDMVYTHMKDGIIASHDIEHNYSFIDFCKNIGEEYHSNRDINPVNQSPREAFGFIYL